MVLNKSIIYCFFIFSFLLLIIDFIWLSIAPKYIYRPNLPGLLLDRPVLWAAILFYFIYSIGVTIIILRPALIDNSVITATWTGFIFGIVAYSTWSLTNMAVLKGWSKFVTIIDISWGGFLTAFASGLAIYLTNKLN
ncbi:MAG: hypothetical protein CFH21_00664 [Alphaproteobacteria bacterium MarineAlpha5_Bin11]|nr:hypothetical protein [Pelagibacteraceae bacterium]PPR43798.1 MAG: hypothetical protein CFH21_00664 [Alphaproteobacteria bacterium MarineAlpha5_Bin11]